MWSRWPITASVFFVWSRVMHGCKPCRAVYLFGCVQEQRTAINLPGTNFLKAGIWGDRRKNCREDVGKGAAGSVFVQWRVRIYEMTNWHMLQHDFPTSSNFILFQFNTGLDTWNSRIWSLQDQFPFPSVSNFQGLILRFSMILWTCIGSVPVVCKWLVVPSLHGVTLIFGVLGNDQDFTWARPCKDMIGIGWVCQAGTDTTNY